MSVRQELEELENRILPHYAMKANKSKGRDIPEEQDFLRTCFMRDRDRIIHSKSFRRLKHKTQVYISPENDHYRTRLTHTLEVNQISQTAGKALGLNLDLIEAIALGHDVGHTPFSHTGEEVLNQLVPGGFRHNENSVRVLTRVEQGRTETGLNLSFEVLDGILCHSGFDREEKLASTLEGQVVRYADKIAYIQHDIDDSIRAGVLHHQDLPGQFLDVLGHSHSERFGTLVLDLVKQSRNNIEVGLIEIGLKPNVKEALLGLRAFMFEQVYRGSFCQAQRERACYVIEFLYAYYKKNCDKLPSFYREISQSEGIERGVADYISGMTDNFCIAVFKELVLPSFYIGTNY